jgi:hypothetical protein
MRSGSSGLAIDVLELEPTMWTSCLWQVARSGGVCVVVGSEVMKGRGEEAYIS